MINVDSSVAEIDYCAMMADQRMHHNNMSSKNVFSNMERPTMQRRKSISYGLNRRKSVLQRIFEDERQNHNANKSGIESMQNASFVFLLLNPTSEEWYAKVFKTFISSIIILDLIIFCLSTEPTLTDDFHQMFFWIEAVTSTIFLVEYIARIATVVEHPSYREYGPIDGRLRYMVTAHALIDLLATAPFFVGVILGQSLPNLTYMRVFRVLRIWKTEGYARAFGACYRVIYFNREILYVACLVCWFLILTTSVLLYYARPRPEVNEYDENGQLTDYMGSSFRSILSTMYLSVLMLTGQDASWMRKADEIPWYTKVSVGITGGLSVAMLAIPVSLLTWGFEAEAERCARRARRRQALLSLQSKSQQKVIVEGLQELDRCNSDEEYQKILTREVDTTATVKLGTNNNNKRGSKQNSSNLDDSKNNDDDDEDDDDNDVDYNTKKATNNKGSINQVKPITEMVKNYLKNDTDGTKLASLTHFLVNPDAAMQQRRQQQQQQQNAFMMRNGDSSIASLDVMDERLETLEFAVSTIHAKLDKICDVVQTVQQQNQIQSQQYQQILRTSQTQLDYWPPIPPSPSDSDHLASSVLSSQNVQRHSRHASMPNLV